MPPPPGSSDERRLARRAGTVGLGVVFSRLTGLVREQVLAGLFPTVLLDAYYAAHTLPNTLREMLGEGALSKSFVAAFSGVDQNEGARASNRLFVRTLGFVAPLTLLVTVLGVAFAPEIVGFVFSREAFDEPLPESLAHGFGTPGELAVRLTRIMFPFLFFASVAGLVMGGLHARGSFFVPSVAGAFFNLTTIAGALLGVAAAPALGVHPMTGLAVGVPVGGLVHVLVQAPSFRRTGFRYERPGPLRERLADPGVRRAARLFAPAAASAGSLQVNVLISRSFASIGASWLAWFSMAYRLVQLPNALIAVGLSNAGLPALSRAAARSDREGFYGVLRHSGRLALALSLAAAAGLFAIAEPAVSLIYQRGAFTPEDARQVAAVLRAFAFGLPAFAAGKIFVDAFFALGSTRLPFAVSCVGIALTFAANRLFVVELGYGHVGLPLATVSVSFVSAMLLAALLAPRLGPGYALRGLRDFASCLLRAIPAALAAGGAASLVLSGLAGRLDPGTLSELLMVALAVVAGTLGFAVVARFLLPEEFRTILDVFRRRGRSGRSP